MASTIAYRSEIDGLRTVAVGFVLLFHANPTLWPGGFVGVDVFFVISGYLIGSILFAEFERRGKVDLPEFWARRFRRLVPSAILVIGATLIMSLVILPAPETYRAGHDALFAAVYLTNWLSLVQAVSYFDDGGGPSLFLHYWSLAVEEQFYMYLSVIFLMAGLPLRRSENSVRFIILLLLGLGAVSFALNLISTADAQPVGFYGTHARIWQFTAGIAVGLAERNGQFPRGWMRSALAIAGLGAIVFCGAWFDGEMGYPGLYAIVPTLGTAALIWAGTGGGSTPADRDSVPGRFLLLGTEPMVRIGRISYVLYLWHWPIFKLWEAQTGRWQVSDMIAATALTLVLSVLTHVLVENPVRYSRGLRLRPTRSLTVLVTCIALCCASATGVIAWASSASLVRLDGGQVVDIEEVRHDRPLIYSDDCHLDQKSIEYSECIYGENDSDEAIFLVGDSHAAHWFPALNTVAHSYGYALHSRTKSACIPVNLPIRNFNLGREYTECAEWREKVMQEIEKIRPDLVVIAASSQQKPLEADLTDAEARELLATAEQDTVERILASGARVALVIDTPWVESDPLDCLESESDRSKCQWPAAESFRDRSLPWASWDDRPEVTIVDMREAICPGGVCAAQRGGRVLLRDRHHLASEFSRSLAKSLASQIMP